MYKIVLRYQGVSVYFPDGEIDWDKTVKEDIVASHISTIEDAKELLKMYEKMHDDKNFCVVLDNGSYLQYIDVDVEKDKKDIETHMITNNIINEIILFGIHYPKDFHLLQYYSQTGGDTLQEYFDRYYDSINHSRINIERVNVSKEYPI